MAAPAGGQGRPARRRGGELTAEGPGGAPGISPGDEAGTSAGGDDAATVLREAGLRLAERAGAVLPAWLAGRAGALVDAAGAPAAPAPDRDRDALVAAAERAGEDVADRLHVLATTDLDRQRTTPLAALRAALAPVEDAMLAAGVLVARAGGAGGHEPGRRPGPGQPGPGDAVPRALAPRSWSEVDAELAELALVWGAAKAAAHRRSHGPS